MMMIMIRELGDESYVFDTVFHCIRSLYRHCHCHDRYYRCYGHCHHMISVSFSGSLPH
jgi:hypothetical protein